MCKFSIIHVLLLSLSIIDYHGFIKKNQSITLCTAVPLVTGTLICILTLSYPLFQVSAFCSVPVTYETLNFFTYMQIQILLRMNVCFILMYYLHKSVILENSKPWSFQYNIQVTFLTSQTCFYQKIL